MYFGAFCELFVDILFLIKFYSAKIQKNESDDEKAKSDEAERVTVAEKELSELLWSSIALVIFCWLFAYFQFYLLYLPFVFHLNRLLFLATTILYPFIIWVIPSTTGLSLSVMLDPLINPTDKHKTS